MTPVRSLTTLPLDDREWELNHILVRSGIQSLQCVRSDILRNYSGLVHHATDVSPYPSQALLSATFDRFQPCQPILGRDHVDLIIATPVRSLTTLPLNNRE
jgi:hypothetical protein